MREISSVAAHGSALHTQSYRPTATCYSVLSAFLLSLFPWGAEVTHGELEVRGMQAECGGSVLTDPITTVFSGYGWTGIDAVRLCWVVPRL